MNWDLALNFFIALIAILNPLGKIPVWASACKREALGVQWRLALIVTATGGAVLFLMLFFGVTILGFFGIDMASFRIAGGIVILLVGISMLQGKLEVQTTHESESEDPLERATEHFRHLVVPLAIPFIAGPGTITTVIVYGVRAQNFVDRATLAGVLAVALILLFLTLLAAGKLKEWLGEIVFVVQTRLFGLILAAVAVQLIVVGLGEVFPEWLNWDSQIQDDVEQNQAAEATTSDD